MVNSAVYDASRGASDGVTQAEVVACFNTAFAAEFGVRMVGGATEPAYLPRTPRRAAIIYCREDFASSALHEAAHWLVATKSQWAFEDYGQIYVPPPRNPAAQARFYAAELPVQALECWLARRAQIPFHASADDPDSSLPVLRAFQARVEQIAAWLDTPVGALLLPPLAQRLALQITRVTAGSRAHC